MHKNETKSFYLIHISTERLTMIMAHSTELRFLSKNFKRSKEKVWCKNKEVRCSGKKSGAKIKKLGAPVKSLVHKYQESGAPVKSLVHKY